MGIWKSHWISLNLLINPLKFESQAQLEEWKVKLHSDQKTAKSVSHNEFVLRLIKEVIRNQWYKCRIRNADSPRSWKSQGINSFFGIYEKNITLPSP